jgi:hypothetical protein
MAQRFFATLWPYNSQVEVSQSLSSVDMNKKPCMFLKVHGFVDKAMRVYMNQTDGPLHVVRGGIFGGTLPYVSSLQRRASAYVLQSCP